MSTTRTLVDLALSHTLREREATVSTLLDTVGVAIAGAEASATRGVRDWLEETRGDAVVWGSAGRVAPTAAALVNGTAAHALDFDDAGITMPIHPSAVLWPTVLAVVPADTETDTVLAAVEAGQIVFRALADLLPVAVHYGAGWHATATLGRIAGALAAARVLRLDPTCAAHAVGIASSMAAGSLANFGSDTKPLHVGLTARDAVTAAGLAAAGVTANPEELDAAGGFLERYGDPTAVPGISAADRLAHWRECWVLDCMPKRWPSCFGTHRAVAAVLRLRDAGLRPEQVESIRVEASPATLRPLLRTPPTTGAEAKFNMEWVVARTLQAGGLGLADFRDEVVGDPAVRLLAKRVEVIGADTPGDGSEVGTSRFARVVARTTDGEVHQATVTLEDSADRPGPEAVRDKFLRCVAAAGRTHEQAETLLAALEKAAHTTTVAHLQQVLTGEDLS